MSFSPAPDLAAMPEPTELYRMAFAACPAGFIVWGNQAQILDWNPAAERIFGWTRAEAMAQPAPHFLVPEAWWPAVDGIFVQLLEAEEPTDSLNDNVTKGGRVIHCEWHNIPMRDLQGKLQGFVSFVQDITSRREAEDNLQAEISERKRAEKELETVLSQSEQILGSITSILISVDENDVITTWNAAAAAVFGLRTADVLGRSFTECCLRLGQHEIVNAVAECLAQRKIVRLDDIRCVVESGKERLLGVTINPINHYSDDPKGFLLLAADITERRGLESQLAQAQKLESIGQLAAGIAHEINTPIQYVGDNLRFLQDSFMARQGVMAAYREVIQQAEAGGVSPEALAAVHDAEDEADAEYLAVEIPAAAAQAVEGVNRVSHIVRAMKEFSHPGAVHKVSADLNRALDSTITVASHEWKYVADVIPDFEPDLPLVPCLPADLNQVFLNIIVNAAHAIADVVGDGANGKGIITVSTRRRDDWVEVRISDTGSGMTEAVKARIFDPFFTTKEVGRGTGQGLAISHAVVVEKHGGTISVQSVPGRGTTFIIGLPLADPSQENTHDH